MISLALRVTLRAWLVMNRKIIFPLLLMLTVLALFVLLVNPGGQDQRFKPIRSPTSAVRAVIPVTRNPNNTQVVETDSLSSLNGIPIEQIVQLPPAVAQEMHTVYLRGQALGNDPRAFSKVGDSTIENPHFLARFDEKPYNLGSYTRLQGAIDYFAGSFARQGMAVQRGLHSWTVFDPMWADPIYCEPNESVIACEFRVHRPSIVLVRLGSNDSGIPEAFEKNLRQLVEYSLAKGVIPVLGTKADRFEGPGNTNNQIIRRVAADYQVPLWDYDRVAQTLPNNGLRDDGIHMTYFYEHDYTLPNALQTGHGVHNLTALMMLDRIWREVMQGD